MRARIVRRALAAIAAGLFLMAGPVPASTSRVVRDPAGDAGVGVAGVVVVPDAHGELDLLAVDVGGATDLIVTFVVADVPTGIAHRGYELELTGDPGAGAVVAAEFADGGWTASVGRRPGLGDGPCDCTVTVDDVAGTITVILPGDGRAAAGLAAGTTVTGAVARTYAERTLPTTIVTGTDQAVRETHDEGRAAEPFTI